MKPGPKPRGTAGHSPGLFVPLTPDQQGTINALLTRLEKARHPMKRSDFGRESIALGILYYTTFVEKMEASNGNP